jgi:hypothetical protein
VDVHLDVPASDLRLVVGVELPRAFADAPSLDVLCRVLATAFAAEVALAPETLTLAWGDELGCVIASDPILRDVLQWLERVEPRHRSLRLTACSRTAAADPLGYHWGEGLLLPGLGPI